MGRDWAFALLAFIRLSVTIMMPAAKEAVASMGVGFDVIEFSAIF